MDNDEITVDLEDRKIQLGSGFEIGKISVMDVFDMVINSVKQTQIWKSTEAAKDVNIELFLSQLKQGDSMALFIAIISSVIAGSLAVYLLSYCFSSNQAEPRISKQDEEEPPAQRDFTHDQLRNFDGIKEKSIYIGLCGEVFDVTAASDFYGEGSCYHCFAGRDSTRAMAKLSFEEEDLANPCVDDLGPFERSNLTDWYEKFKYYKCYPVMGKVSTPPNFREFSKEQLAEYKGQQPVLENRVDAEIYLAIKGKVLDVSYGGKEMYSTDGPYHRFAGIDASRALAKMSFQPEDVESSNLSDLTPEQLKTLDDWERKFVDVKKYPVVGTLKQ